MKQSRVIFIPRAAFLGIVCLFPKMVGAQGVPPDPCYCPPLMDSWGTLHPGVVYDANGSDGAWNPWQDNHIPPQRKILTLLCNAAPEGDSRTHIQAIAIPLEGFIGKHYQVEEPVTITANESAIEVDYDFCYYYHTQWPSPFPWVHWIQIGVSYQYYWSLPHGQSGGNFQIQHLGVLPANIKKFPITIKGQANAISAPSYFDIHLSVKDYNSPPMDCDEERAGADDGMEIDATVKVLVYPKIYLPEVPDSDIDDGLSVNGFYATNAGPWEKDWANVFRAFDADQLSAGETGFRLIGNIHLLHVWVEVQKSLPWQPCVLARDALRVEC